MRRIILHWTAGGNTANAVDRRHYHKIIELAPNGAARVVDGNQPIEANARISSPGDISTYAAHTRGTNTGSIGIAVAGMRKAKERPFSAGPSPMTPAQIDLLCKTAADLAARYGIPISRETVLTHAEVEPTLGIWQRNKWDIVWLPGMDGPGDPIAVGDELRARIRKARSKPAARVRDAARATKDEASTPGGMIAIGIAILVALFGLFG